MTASESAQNVSVESRLRKYRKKSQFRTIWNRLKKNRLAIFGLILFTLMLGVVATAVAHTLFISGLKAVPAQLAGICSSMETVYGILFALLLLGERLAPREIAGAAVIVGAVVAAQAFSSLSRT